MYPCFHMMYIDLGTSRTIQMRINSEEGDFMKHDIYELVQERRNSSALAMELCLSCTNP